MHELTAQILKPHIRVSLRIRMGVSIHFVGVHVDSAGEMLSREFHI